MNEQKEGNQTVPFNLDAIYFPIDDFLTLSHEAFWLDGIIAIGLELPNEWESIDNLEEALLDEHQTKRCFDSITQPDQKAQIFFHVIISHLSTRLSQEPNLSFHQLLRKMHEANTLLKNRGVDD